MIGTLFRLPFPEPVTQAIGCDDVEHFPGAVVASFDVELGEFFVEAVGLELRKQRLDLRHVEGTAVLRRVAAIFRESDLDLVPGEYRRLGAERRCVTAPESRARFRRTGAPPRGPAPAGSWCRLDIQRLSRASASR